MPNRLWMTRTLPHAHESAGSFAHTGLAVGIAPLLKLSPPSDMPKVPPKEAALIFTSSNGLDWFCKFTSRRDWTVVTVGDATAKRAKANGCTSVFSASGSSKDVTALIKSKFPVTQTIIHCAGRQVRGSIIEDLTQAGYSARRDIFYETHPVTKMPNIDLQKLTYIALYSPQAAKTLAGFKPDLSGITMLSISQATDEALGNIKCQSRLIAKSPNETAMLTLLAPILTV